METKLLHPNDVNVASKLLKQGELVAFPTETVYGLGALATNERAVRKVYQAKGRPSDNPLIVHLASAKEIAKYAQQIPSYFTALADHFWPGPLTVVLPLKDNLFSKSVTGGLATCAFRVPDNQIARDLLSLTGPVVAPSANTSGKPSPTEASHVLDDLAHKIAAVIDGGRTQVGVESTVIDLTDSHQITILRPGGISAKQIQAVTELPVIYDKHLLQADEAPKAPGMKYKHYSPQTKVLMLGLDSDLPEALIAYHDLRLGLLANEQLIQQSQNLVQASYSLGADKNAQSAAHNLFAGLRSLDKENLDLILVETYSGDDSYSQAYMNRLQKAAAYEYFEK